MKNFNRSVFSLLILISLKIDLFGSSYGGQQDSEIFAVATVSDINRLLNTISLYAILETQVSTGVVFEDKYLIGFGNYLDYQWVGAGKTAYVYPGKIATFIAEKLNTGTPPEDISKLLIDAFELGEFNVDLQEVVATEDQLRMKIGAYMVGEIEFHQEPDGHFKTLLEINQAKLFFSGHFDGNRNNVNAVDFLAEFNPIPEEVIHHIDFLIVPHAGHADTISFPEASADAVIPFERLNFSVSNLAKSGLQLTFGQIRNPFGIWSDFSSHRNFSTVKNNLLVNGFALKKIELGIQLDRKFGPIDVTAAVVHGRQGRTFPLSRENLDDKFDGVVHATYTRRGFRCGVSGYFAEMGVRRSAFGAEFTMDAGKFLIGGELIYQRNLDFGKMLELDDVATRSSSLGAYLQVDWAISQKLHAYGLYNLWNLYLDGEIVNHPVFSTFHGLRYYIVKNVRWTMIEYGFLGHRQFDEGQTHLSTQLEVTF